MSVQSRVGWVFQPLSVNVGSIARWMLVNTIGLFLREWAQRHWTYPLVVFLHENLEGRLAREGVGRVFLRLSLVAVPFPEAFASGRL